MAKRMSTTPARKSASRAASKKADSTKLGEAIGQEPQSEKQNPAAGPMPTTPEATARELSAVAQDMIARRAYEIWASEGGSDVENWLKAERELRGKGLPTS